MDITLSKRNVFGTSDPYYFVNDLDDQSRELLSHLLKYENTGFSGHKLDALALLAKAHGWRLVIDGIPYEATG